MEKYNMEMETSLTTIPGKMMNRIKPNSVVLEFGCAYGRMTKYMKEKLHCQVYVVELDPEAYQHAIQYAVDGYCGDIETGLWKEKFTGITFDYILFADVLEHLKQPEHVLLTAKEQLTLSGEVFISIPNIAHYDILANLYLNRFQYTKIGLLDDTHIHFWGAENLKNLADTVGCGITVLDGVYQVPYGTEQQVHRDDIPTAFQDFMQWRKYNDVYQFFMVLQKKEWMDTQNISTQILLRNENTELESYAYWNMGDGYQTGQCVRLHPQVLQGGRFRFRCENIPKNCKYVRFDPALGQVCLLSDIHVYTNMGSCEIYPLNGTSVYGVTVFSNTTPQMEFQLQDHARWFEITAWIQLFSGYEISEVFTAIQKQPVYENTQQLLQGKIASLTAEQEAWEQERLALQKQIKTLTTERGTLQEQIATLTAEHTDEVQKQIVLQEQVFSLNAEKEALEKDRVALGEVYDKMRVYAKSLQEQNTILQMQYNCVINSQCWRITAPIRAMLDAIKRTKIGMLLYKTARSLRNAGLKETLKKISQYRHTKKVIRLRGCDFVPLTLSDMANKVQELGGSVYHVERLSLEKSTNKKKCLLISHELNLTGAPVALGYMAKAIENMGHLPIIISPHAGALCTQLVEENFPVFIYNGVYETDFIKRCVNLFDYIIVSTNVGAPVIAQLNGSHIPVLWWIHEARASYHPEALASMPETLEKNIYVYCGGSYAQKLLKEYRPNYQAKELLYYTPDYAASLPKQLSFMLSNIEGKTVFAVVGMQEERKGQDILVQAIKMMNPEYRKNSLFVFVGKPYYRPIQEAITILCAEYPLNVKYIEELNRNDLISLYMQIDCLICSSRDDPMPIVVTEAMQMSKVIICSSNTGSASILEQFNAGLIFHNNDPMELARCIEHVYLHRGANLEPMCKRARNAYENSFTEDVFQNKIEMIIHEMCDGSSSSLQRYDGTVSVIIPTYNAGDSINDLIASLQTQESIRGVEIIIVDSESKDGTAEKAEKLGANVIHIKQAEFSHSYARNLGAKHATGDYLLFMTQDALPDGSNWIAGLLQPVLNYGVVAVSCKERPRDDCDLLGRISIWLHSEYMEILHSDRIMKLPKRQNYDGLRKNAQLNDVTCLVDRELFKQFGYQGDYAEDLDLGLRLIRSGHKLALLSSVQVIHSHTRPAFYHMKRALVDVKTLKHILDDMPVEQVTGQMVANRVITAYCTISMLVKCLNGNPIEDTWEKFQTIVQEHFIEIKSEVLEMSTQSMLEHISQDYPYCDERVRDYVLELFDVYQETFEVDFNAAESAFYFIHRVVMRYYHAQDVKISQKTRDDIIELLPKYTAQLFGLLMASYACTDQYEDAAMYEMVKRYSSGV